MGLLTMIAIAMSGWNIIEQGHRKPGMVMIFAGCVGMIVYTWRSVSLWKKRERDEGGNSANEKPDNNTRS